MLNRSLTIDWKGRSHNLVIDMRIINRVEEHLNTITMLDRAVKGDVRLGQAALLFSILLQECGENVKQEEVFAEFGKGAKTIRAVSSLCVHALSLMFPQVEEKKPVKPNTKRSTATRGKTSTK